MRPYFSDEHLVLYFFAAYFIAFVVAWLVLKCKKVPQRKVKAYEDFLNLLYDDKTNKVMFIPGGPNIMKVEDTLLFSHCMRFLETHKELLNDIELTILVICPFKYAYLQEFLQKHQITATLDYVATEQMPFVAASMGIIDRTRPNLSMMTGAYAFENLILGDIASAHGSYFSAAAEPSALPDTAVVSQGLIMAEEAYAMPLLEGEKNQCERIFLVANDLIRIVILLIIIIGSIIATI